MIISVNWLKKFTDIDVSIDELATLIGERLVEIEKVENIGAKYEGVVVAKVVEAAPLEGSDHLNVTKLDDGGVVAGVERDENGYVQVVCGAANVRAGLLVAWLPPNSTVPETFYTAEAFVLGAKPLRGVMSNGMIASARELDLYDDHTGILEIDKDAQPGSSFAELYELNDYLLDIENKSLTHRPDAFGVIGFAREVAGIQGKAFKTPEWLHDIDPTFQVENGTPAPAVVIEDPSLSDRFQAIVLDGIDETAVSPVQLQTYLARSGVRPINASVDVSNYLMLLTGQPTHAYDYDKVKAVAGDDFTIRVRMARENEKLTLLDGKEVTLDTSDIVIAAGDTAIGLAGVMGGANTIVDASTKTVLFEAATFNLYNLRSTHMRHGIFSEAVTRFTKGVPAPLSSPVIAEAVNLLGEYADATVASAIGQDYPGQREPIIVSVEESRINNVLGTHFAAEDIAELLTNVGFEVAFHGLTAQVTVPYWREDIHIPEDIIEEVGRLAGYDTINVTLPRRDFVAVKPSAFDSFKETLRTRLVRAGANEVLTYSFVHGDILKKSEQQPDNSYRIVNSISPELQYYRQTLTPSLLSHIHANTKAGYEQFSLFELNKVHQKADGLTDESVPVERHSLALVLADAKRQDAAYYQAKNILEYALATLNITLRYEPLSDESVEASPFEAKRAASVVDAKTGANLGVIGEYKRSVQKAFKLPVHTAGFELLLENISGSINTENTYRPLSRYPSTERDICFQVASDVSYQQIIAATQTVLEATTLISTVSPIDISQQDEGTKNITIRIRLGSYDGTLTADEVTKVINGVVTEATDKTQGKVV